MGLELGLRYRWDRLAIGPIVDYNRFHNLVMHGLAVFVPEGPEGIDDPSEGNDGTYDASQEELHSELAKERPTPSRTEFRLRGQRVCPATVFPGVCPRPSTINHQIR